MTNDDQKSVLDVIGWCKDLEDRLGNLENLSGNHIETGDFEVLVHRKKLSGKFPLRTMPTEIVFKKPFSNKPILLPSISHIDLGHSKSVNTTCQINVVNLSNKGARIQFITKSETNIDKATINWLAIGMSEK